MVNVHRPGWILCRPSHLRGCSVADRFVGQPCIRHLVPSLASAQAASRPRLLFKTVRPPHLWIVNTLIFALLYLVKAAHSRQGENHAWPLHRLPSDKTEFVSGCFGRRKDTGDDRRSNESCVLFVRRRMPPVASYYSLTISNQLDHPTSGLLTL